MSKTLTVYLAADVSKLNSGLSKAKRGLKDFEDGSTSLGSKLSGMVGPAMIGAAAAAGAFAVSLAVDGVKAAIEDEKAVAKLSTTLDNLGFGAATEQSLAFMDSLQRQYGVSEDLLRPAFERQVIATNNVALSQKNLQLIMDIAAGTGKSLEAVSNALGKAYEGNTGALGKLGTGIDKATLKTGDMKTITAQLATTFTGQAAAAADTFSGKMSRLSIGFDELKESFGKGFLSGIEASSGGVENLVLTMERLEPKMEALGKKTGEVVVESTNLAGSAVIVQSQWEKFAKNNFIVQALQSALDRQDLLKQGFALLNIMAAGAAETEYKPAGPTGLQLLTNYGTFGKINQLNAVIKEQNDLLKGNGAAVNTVTKENKALQDRYQKTLEIFNSAKTALGDATTQLKKWNDEIDSFITTTAGKITSGIDIGAAFDKATSEAGKAAGLTTVKAFQDQLAQSLKFGNSLQKLKSSGAEDNLIQQVASVGPEAGVALVDELVQSGMIPEIQAQLNDVEASAKWLAASLVPPFLTEGQSAARAAVGSALIEFNNAKEAMFIAGKAAGKTFGAGLLDEIKKAIEEAQAAMQNVKAGAGVSTIMGQDFTAYPGGSPLSAQEANFFDIAAYNANYAAAQLNTGNDIARVIQQSNNRIGYYEIPTIAPVLQ